MMNLRVHRTRAHQPWTFTQLDLLQRRLAADVKAGGTLLFSELEPVITLGRRAEVGARGLTVSRQELRAEGVALVETDRGGLATWHGPGQWVVFPVERLERLTGDPRGVRDLVCGLLKAAQEVAADFGVEAEVREGAELGLWVVRTGKKLASVGVHVEGGVVLHGLSLNVWRHPLAFWGIRPCGLDLPVGALLDEWPDPLTPALRESLFVSVGKRLARAIQRQFFRDERVSSLDEPGLWG